MSLHYAAYNRRLLALTDTRCYYRMMAAWQQLGEQLPLRWYCVVVW